MGYLRPNTTMNRTAGTLRLSVSLPQRVPAAGYCERWASHTMVRFIIAVLVFVSVATPVASAQEFGRYVGTVQAEWRDDGRKMRLLVPFAYIDPKGLEWQAPAGWIIDGASIPQFAWSIIEPLHPILGSGAARRPSAG